MDASGADSLILPNEWAGEKLHSLSHLRSASEGLSVEGGVGTNTIRVRGPANRPVAIEYDLQRDWTGPFVNPLEFHPVLMPQYIEFTGSNALIRRNLPDQALETANFDWEQLPNTWALATSFGTSASANKRCQTFSGTWARVNEGLYAAGDYRIHAFKINGQPAYLAIRGAWTFTDGEAIADIRKVVGIVRDFWHDNRFPYFLVTLSPFDRDHGSADGSEFTNAFWMFVSRLDRLNGLLPTLAHESFHTWNPGKMGFMPSGYDENPIKWFREGPTDYYAQLLTYRASEISASDYVDSLNAALLRFPTSDDEYVRGRVISLWLDGTIRKESGGSKSLDNVMFDLIQQGNLPYTLERILAAADRYLSPSSQTLLENAVSRHGELPAPAELPVLGTCAHAALGDFPSFDLGFDFDKTAATKIVSGVTDNGPAFNAGMRNGQALLASSFSKHNPDRQASFTIRAETGNKRITFYPRGAPIQAWQYRLDQTQSCGGIASTAQGVR